MTQCFTEAKNLFLFVHCLKVSVNFKDNRLINTVEFQGEPAFSPCMGINSYFSTG